MLKGFNHVGEIRMYWQSWEQIYLKPSHEQNQNMMKSLVDLYSYIMEYEVRVIGHLSSS